MKKPRRQTSPPPPAAPDSSTGRTMVLRQKSMAAVLTRVAPARVESPDRALGDGETAPVSPSPSIEDAMNAALGCRSSDVALFFLSQLVLVDDPADHATSNDEVDAVLARNTALLAELEPKNATQAMLAAQMVAVQRVAMTCMHRSVLPGQAPPAIDANVLRATRLMRLWVEQAEMMTKLKGTSGQQKVTVEHVTVQSGGQAVVGVAGGRPDA